MYDWIEELRSGRWVPAFGTLKSSTIDNGRCPLGVLGELIGAAFSPEDVYLSQVPVKSNSNETGFAFPEQVIPWFGGFPEAPLCEMSDDLFTAPHERLTDGDVPSFGIIPLVLGWMHDAWTLRGSWPDPWLFLTTRIVDADPSGV
jgi:hypothetical protein